MPAIDNHWNMLGHEWAVELLRGHLAQQRTRHAYLFTGPQGVGRRTLALRLAQALNCSQPAEAGLPCGNCRACTFIERMQHPDLLMVQSEESSNILKVEQVRDLQRSLSLAPYEASYKIALLLRFEEANPSAANALLKTLEEPPPQVVMLLTASDAEALLPTIVSRCEVIRLRPLPLDQVSAGLHTRWGLPAQEAQLLAHIAGGRPGYAIGLSQNPELLAQRRSQLEDHQKLLAATRIERFAYAEELAKNRAALQSTLQTWLTFWRDVMLRTASSSTPLTNLDWQGQIEALANRIDLSSAQKLVVNIERTIEQVERYVNARLALEVLMLDLPNL